MPLGYFSNGQAYRLRWRYDETIAEYKKAIKIDPKYAMAVFTLI